MHEVLLSRQAERDLKRLPAESFHRTVRKIRSLANEPRPPGTRKIVGSTNDYRIRVGEHRIVYEIDDDVHEVRILRVRHRREAYR